MSGSVCGNSFKWEKAAFAALSKLRDFFTGISNRLKTALAPDLKVSVAVPTARAGAVAICHTLKSETAATKATQRMSVHFKARHISVLSRLGSLMMTPHPRQTASCVSRLQYLQRLFAPGSNLSIPRYPPVSGHSPCKHQSLSRACK